MEKSIAEMRSAIVEYYEKKEYSHKHAEAYVPHDADQILRIYNIISASKAKSIALKHAGVSSGDAKGMECEYDVEDGVKLYEVSFRAGKYEYDYEINAITGKIISWDKEIDD